eukprot:SAG31_NODE_823_length_11772_cov_10.262229_6_plen_78_part_00
MVPEEEAVQLWKAIEIERSKHTMFQFSVPNSESSENTKVADWLSEHAMQHCTDSIQSEGVLTVEELRAFVVKREDFE